LKGGNMTKKITKNERIVLRYLSRHLHGAVTLSMIVRGTGLSPSEVNTALTYLDQNVLLSDVSKIRIGKWNGNSRYQILNQYSKTNDIEKQLVWDCRNLRRDIIKMTKKINNTNKHPQIVNLRTTLIQVITEMNNSVALSNLGQVPVANI
jgi:hypothetical protein